MPYFKFEAVLKFYNLEARLGTDPKRKNSLPQVPLMKKEGGIEEEHSSLQ